MYPILYPISPTLDTISQSVLQWRMYDVHPLPLLDRVEVTVAGSLEFRAGLLNERLLNHPAVLAQRIESEFTKRMLISGVWEHLQI